MIEDIARLGDLAEGQHGHVTTQQAAHAGITAECLDELISGHVAEWVAPGAVLRLRGGGRHPFPRLYATWLQLAPSTPAWERIAPTSGVVSHGAAVRVHGLGALPGPSAEFTLSGLPAVDPTEAEATVHRSQLDPGDWQIVEDLPVTTPTRTFIDIAGTGRADIEQLGRIAATLLRKHPAAQDEVTSALDHYLAERGLSGSGSALLGALLASAADGDALSWTGR
ncbi:hypothetical protein ACGFR8_13735 [Streptomyces brevispora]|uniref:hypothetical protein n=1 Tax=Streptomyces brevispora TaxID=887462 RepID=UPI0037249FF1